MKSGGTSLRLLVALTLTTLACGCPSSGAPPEEASADATWLDSEVGGIAGHDGLEPAAPTVVIFSPESGSTVSGVVPIAILANDDVGVAEVRLTLNGAPLGVITGAPWILDWDTAGYSNGPYVLGATARDGDGNESDADEVTLTLANASSRGCAYPTVTVTSPMDHAVVCGTVGVKALVSAACGLSLVELFADETKIGETTSEPFFADWDTAAVADGLHLIRVQATDAVGQRQHGLVTVDVDNQAGDCDNPPQITILTPGAGAYLNGVVTIEADATDFAGAVDRVVFQVDGKQLQVVTQEPYRATWNTAVVAEGPYTIKAVAFNQVGRRGEAQVAVTVDRTPPTVFIGSPADGFVVTGDVTILAQAQDNAALESVTFAADGPAGHVDLAVLNQGPFQATWSIAGQGGGTYTLSAVALDRAGLTGKDSVEVTVKGPPSVVIDSPANGETVSGLTTIEGEASGQLGIAKVEVRIDGAHHAQIDHGGPFSFSWDTTAFAAGEHVISVIATDSLGVTATAKVTVLVEHSQVFSVKVCTTASFKSCSKPGLKAVDVTGLLHLEAVAGSGASIKTLELRVDGVSIQTLNAAPYQISWDSTAVSDGLHLVAVRGSMSDGAVADVAFDLLVNNCDADHDQWLAVACGGEDCDDTFAGVNPGATDTVNLGYDANCDGAPGVDADGDGHASSKSGGDDCNDGQASVYPCAPDVAGDGVDANCDGKDLLSCDDCDPCTSDTFAGGACKSQPLALGAVCNDGNPCTTGETCTAAGCTAKEANTCDDGNPCTSDGCSPVTGCTHAQIAGCDDCPLESNTCTPAPPSVSAPTVILTSIQIGADGKPGAALNIDPDKGQADCAPVGQCSSGLDNAASGLGSFSNGPLKDAVDDGSLAMLLVASGSLGGVFEMRSYFGELADASCDWPKGGCPFLATKLSYDCDCGLRGRLKGATLAQGKLSAGGDDSAVLFPYHMAEGAVFDVMLYRARLQADVEIVGASMSIAKGVLGGAIRTSELLDAIDGFAGEDIGGLPKSTIKLFLGSLQPDIDTDGDGQSDAISLGLAIKGASAEITGLK